MQNKTSERKGESELCQLVCTSEFQAGRHVAARAAVVAWDGGSGLSYTIRSRKAKRLWEDWWFPRLLNGRRQPQLDQPTTFAAVEWPTAVQSTVQYPPSAF